MTSRKGLIKLIKRSAKSFDIPFKLARSGSNHDIWVLGTTVIPIPRHTEIRNQTAEDILRECEEQLGKGWWRG